MKLNLNDSEVSSIAASLVGSSPMGEDLSSNTNLVIDAIARLGIRSLTRKDVTAVLSEMGTLAESNGKVDPKLVGEAKWKAVWTTVLSRKGVGPWDVIGQAIRARCEPTDAKGVWSPTCQYERDPAQPNNC